VGNILHVDIAPTSPGSGPHFNSEEVLSELNRILHSETFRTSDSHRSFLRYVVEQTLLGHGQDIKEYSVATEALGKDNSFDPRLDPIVRIQASKLRARLAKYYATEGLGNPLRIGLPKGSYSPAFLPADSVLREKEEEESKPEIKAAPAPLSQAETVRPAAMLRPSRRAMFAIATLCVASVIAGWLIVKRTSAAGPISQASIVITPFQNLSDSREDDFFSDGLTEELIDSMARLRDVHVIGRTSAFQFKGKAVDIREIGKELDVATVLQGTVRRYNGRVRVTAQLSDSARATVLWSQIFDDEVIDTVSIQSDIANAITAELGVHLASRTNRAPSETVSAAPGTVNRRAYEDYLKGRYFCDKRTPNTVSMGIDYLQQAVRLDSAFAPAWTGLADCYAGSAGLTGEPHTVSAPKIASAARKAIAIDPNMGQAYVALGVAEMFGYDWAQAEKDFLKGIGLSPNDAHAHYSYGNYLLLTGRVKEALRQMQLALSLDPISSAVAGGLGHALRFDGQLDAAIAQFKKAQIMDPNYGSNRQELTMAYLQKHMYSEAIIEVTKAVQLMDNIGDPSAKAQLGFAYAKQGRPQEARAMLDDLLPLAENNHFPAGNIAAIYLGLGDYDKAFAWWDRAIDVHATVFLKADPIYDPVRSDPRLARLLMRMNLNDSPAPVTTSSLLRRDDR
jgi:TolB-like protein/tetratricopeptide (TPR) repeat protein